MASSSKQHNVYTEDPGDEGEIGKFGDNPSQIRTKGGNVGGGGSIIESYPMDNVHGVKVPLRRVDDVKMGGSPTNLSHSLSGASMVPRQTGRKEVKNDDI